MLIAQTKKKENIAEYLLYMWQIEDIIRAYKFDIDLIQINIIDNFGQPDEVKQEIRSWYSDLIQMMHQEKIEDAGHLQINKNIIQELTSLHLNLIETDTAYKQIYYKTLPFIVEIRAKTTNREESEIENCFSALYGFLLLKLQGKEISGETQAAISQISSLLRNLSKEYKDKQDLSLKD